MGRYLVGVSAAVVAHSLLQLVINVSRLLRKSPLIPSRNHAWLTYAGDQVVTIPSITFLAKCNYMGDIYMV